MIDSHLTFPANADVVSRYGICSAYEAAETYVLRAAKLMRIAEKERAQLHWQIEQSQQELSKTEEMNKELKDTSKEKNTVSQLYHQVKKSLSDSKLKLQKAQDGIWAAEEEKAFLTSELTISRASIKALEESLAALKFSMDVEIAACKLEAADQYEAGFNTALKQVQIIAYEVDILEAYVWKEIVDGKLVAPGTENENIAEEAVATIPANSKKI